MLRGLSKKMDAKAFIAVIIDFAVGLGLVSGARGPFSD